MTGTVTVRTKITAIPKPTAVLTVFDTARYEHIPKIIFTKGGGQWLEAQAKIGASAIGLDWQTDIAKARRIIGNNITLQGNFDPSRLLSPISEIQKMVKEMIDGFGTTKYIANLGHGILPETNPDMVEYLVGIVKNY